MGQRRSYWICFCIFLLKLEMQKHSDHVSVQQYGLHPLVGEEKRCVGITVIDWLQMNGGSSSWRDMRVANPATMEQKPQSLGNAVASVEWSGRQKRLFLY